MPTTGTKTVALGVATGVLTWGIQELSTGNTTTGVVGIAFGLLLFAGYQYAEESDHEQAYHDIVDTIGTDTLIRLGELSAEEIDRRLGQTNAANGEKGE